ncbi:MAG: cyclase family protein, partial [Candidatus Omnitrophica bacterium]|nr:cyclase family protein [Candidatus Omnitrophota bacterium]
YYPANKLACKDPVIIDCPKRPGGIIGLEDMTALKKEKKADAVLIRTGFYKYRSSDVGIYCEENPCLSPAAADWLRKNLRNLKIFGIDSISISSRAHRGVGAESHKILLTDRRYDGGPVLILEDLYLPAGLKTLDELLIFPLFSADIDSSPCTVIGVIHG